MVRYAIVETPWYPMLIAAAGGALCGARLPARSTRTSVRELQSQWPGIVRDDAILPGLQEQIRAYFARERVRFRVRLDLSFVSPFRRKVLEACAAVPYGATTTYADLAARAGSPRAGRAAGSTMANNPIPLVIPCHRVLRSDGTLGGFSARGGLNLKRRMLAWEVDHP